MEARLHPAEPRNHRATTWDTPEMMPARCRFTVDPDRGVARNTPSDFAAPARPPHGFRAALASLIPPNQDLRQPVSTVRPSARRSIFPGHAEGNHLKVERPAAVTVRTHAPQNIDNVIADSARALIRRTAALEACRSSISAVLIAVGRCCREVVTG
jgi:hypothetical protein